MNLLQDPVSGLMLPRQFVDEKQALKKLIDEMVEKAVNANLSVRENYYLVLHAKFNKHDPTRFEISEPIMTFKLPPFVSNQMVFWISPKKGIVELLWMTSKKNGKMNIEFNTQGVAYLQAKGVMPSK